MMNFTSKTQERLKNISTAISRFWFSSAVYILVTILLIISIARENYFETLIITLVFTGFIGIAIQLFYEHFLTDKARLPILLYIGALFFAFAYYMYLESVDSYSYSVIIRNSVLLFLLVILPIWIPAIKQREDAFPKSFLAFIKAYFISSLTTLVLMIGLLAVIGAFHFLIMEVDFKVYGYILTLAWSGFFPLYFLSLLPEFPRNEIEENSKYRTAVSVPRFLEVLLSYIVIPIIIAYTFILLFYILSNLAYDFWNNSELEPLLVGYIIAGWVTLFLIDTIPNRFVQLFKKYFPYLLLVVTVLQGISSLIKVNNSGITHGRYIALLFVLFSITSSAIYLFNRKKLFWIPGILLVLSTVSILPYIDAVTIGINSQMNRLEKVLAKNDMLENGEIKADGSISQTDKEAIVESYVYLDDMDSVQDIPYFSKNYSGLQYSEDFTNTFGFTQYDLEEASDEIFSPDEPHQFSAWLNSPVALDVADFDFVVQLGVSYGNFTTNNNHISSFTFDGEDYQLIWEEDTITQPQLRLEKDSETLMIYDLSELREILPLDSILNQQLSQEELTFSDENENVRMQFVVTDISVTEEYPIDVNFYLMIAFKN